MAKMVTIEESTRLLRAIFPNYPNLSPCRPAPPPEAWRNPEPKPNDSAAESR